MLILDQLSHSEYFTTVEQSVISFIKEYPHLVVDMNIRELAMATYTSNTTIIRICKKLGYKGYKDFKLAFIVELEAKKHENNYVNFNTPFFQEESTLQIINSMSYLYKQSIDLISSSLDIKTLETITKLIINSQKLFIFSIGDTRITTQSFINKVIKLNIYPILATENYEELNMIYNITKNDCALIVSYNMSLNNYLKICMFLNKRNIPIIVITANETSKVLNYIDYKIIIPAKEEQDKIATFYSQISFEYILNILYSMIFNYNYSNNHRHKQLMDKD